MDPDRRINVNLIFEDGAPALHLQVFPEGRCVKVFGGVVNLSEKLLGLFMALHAEGKAYPSIADLLPYSKGQVNFLYFANAVTGDEILCREPQWSREELFLIFNYHLVEEIPAKGDARLVMAARIGREKEDSVPVNFYEDTDNRLLIELEGVLYKPVKGYFVFDYLESYFYYSKGGS